MIKYRVENNVEIDLKSKKYHIKGEVPKYDGCVFCIHRRTSSRGKDRCNYYRIFLEKLKIFCSDFVEKIPE